MFVKGCGTKFSKSLTVLGFQWPFSPRVSKQIAKGSSNLSYLTITSKHL